VAKPPSKSSSASEAKRRDLHLHLRDLADKLEAAQQARRRPGTVWAALAADIQGPIAVHMSIGHARELAQLLRELAAGKSLDAAYELPARRRGAPSADAAMRYWFVRWLQLRSAPMTKKLAHAELKRTHPGAAVPSLKRLDRWWLGQNEETRARVFWWAENEAERRPDGRLIERERPRDLSSVRADWQRGAWRGLG